MHLKQTKEEDACVHSVALANLDSLQLYSQQIKKIQV